MPDSAYIAALKMLGGRELSERQLRQRLARRDYDQDDDRRRDRAAEERPQPRR